MPRVCLRCKNSFKNYGSLRIGFNHCPISDCTGEVVDIDDMIYQTIMSLNKNGYKTKYSCSGHVNEAQPRIYVIFERGVHFEESFLHLLNSEGFSVESNGSEDIMIYKDFDNETSQDQKYINLMNYNMKLFLLVQGLPMYTEDWWYKSNNFGFDGHLIINNLYKIKRQNTFKRFWN